MKTIFLLMSTLLALFSVNAYGSEPKAKYVILITIDGMRGEMVTDAGMPSPTLKLMARGGMIVKRVIGVPPTATYPSHTTIITGVVPAKHHIYYNRPFNYNKAGTRISYWYADSIAVPTIWQKAKEKGLTTASLFWPVSTGSRWIDYNVPEFWDGTFKHNQAKWLAEACTPKGLLEELQQNACGPIDSVNLDAGSMVRDSRTALMANYLINHYNPRLLTIHLITTDYAQHATGTHSQRTMEAVRSVDNAIGMIIENLRIKGRMDSTQIIVTGDHGFNDIHTGLSPNVWLVKAGLLSEKPGGNWKACFYTGGSTSFLYLKDVNDKKSLNKIKKLLSNLPVETKSLFRIASKKELTSKGADPRAALALEPVSGVEADNKRIGPDVYSHGGGSHGYLSGCDPTVLVAYGAGVQKGKRVDVIHQTDIFGYIKSIIDQW